MLTERKTSKYSTQIIGITCCLNETYFKESIKLLLEEGKSHKIKLIFLLNNLRFSLTKFFEYIRQLLCWSFVWVVFLNVLEVSLQNILKLVYRILLFHLNIIQPFSFHLFTQFCGSLKSHILTPGQYIDWRRITMRCFAKQFDQVVMNVKSPNRQWFLSQDWVTNRFWHNNIWFSIQSYSIKKTRGIQHP